MESQEVYTKQQRIAELAKLHRGLSFTSLAHHIDLDWLKEAFRCTRKDAAVGVDQVTAAEYAANLEGNLQSLLERLKSGSYFAPPVRRVYIPKGDGGQKRPLGIPTLEDKVLQRAVVMLLTPIYEEDFLDCSYAFRTNRSVHQAVEVLWKTVMGMGGCWVLEVDIRKYFETMKHGHMREFLKRRISDGVIRRVVDKWLKAGVLEDGDIHYQKEGTPQGGVISPLLSNIYLHEVLDTWFEREIRPRLAAEARLIRYADDFVIICKQQEDVLRVAAVLPKRFGRYGLSIHPEKTRIVRCTKPVDGGPQPESFDFLGFTHYWGRSLKGYWTVKRKTAKVRLKRAIRRVHQWCKEHRHDPLEEQHKALCRKMQGHYGFYGITHNGRSLRQYRTMVERVWRYWLNQRSRQGDMPWVRFVQVLARHRLPQPCIVHSCLANP